MSLFVVAGSPVAHSLSPSMHNAAFKALDMRHHRYGAVEVGIGDTHRVVALIRSKKLAGANITYPLKSPIVRMLDETRGDANDIGAANTLFPENGRVIGTSTDGIGCMSALAEKGVSPNGKTVLIIGAGGAARPIAMALSREHPKRILISNRTMQKAIDLAAMANAHSPCEGAGLDMLTEWVPKADIVIQASSMGMRHQATLPLPSPRALRHRPTVMDIVYTPLETPLLALARKESCPTLDGIDLLVWQGALSFKQWTGVMPPTDIMRQAALSELGDGQ